MANVKKDAEAAAEAKNGSEKLVKAFYPEYAGTRDSGDIQVGINGVNYLVKRGVEVMIPEDVKEVIDYSVKEDQKIARMLEELEQDS